MEFDDDDDDLMADDIKKRVMDLRATPSASDLLYHWR